MSRTKTKQPSRYTQKLTGLLPKWAEERYIVPALLVLAAITRFATIAKASIWHDEGFTMMLIARNPAEIWAGSGRDVHPPLFYELLHFWTNLFGRSELAARSMSAVAGIVTIYVCYLLVKRYFAKTTGYLVLLILAVAPFLVRYSQEARMYGVLGLFLITGTYALLRALEPGDQKKWWVVYVVMMAAGLYTHYFTALAMMAQWIYLLSLTPIHAWRLGKTPWLSARWWLANIAIVVLWIPWLPSFYGQISRGQGISWIPKTTAYTLPNNLWQNLTFTDGRQLPQLLYWIVPALILLGAVWVTWILRKSKPQIKMLFFYTFVPIVLTIVVSIIKPVYQDRYLVFAANGIYMLLGITLHQLIARHRATGLAALVLVVGISLVGVINVGRQASHSMGKVGDHVVANYKPGDEMVSAELYTYFDFSYYCTDVCIDSRNRQVEKGMMTAVYPAPWSQLRLNTTGGRPNGYGESALLYDRADQIYVDDWAVIRPASGRVWMIGKPGDKPYWKSTPSNWTQVDSFVTNSSEARLYQVQ